MYLVTTDVVVDSRMMTFVGVGAVTVNWVVLFATVIGRGTLGWT